MGEHRRSLRLGFAGTPDFAVPALRALAAHHQVCAVYTQPDRGAGRGRSVRPGAVKRCAEALGIAVHQPARFEGREVLEPFAALHLDALVVVAYGLILPLAALQIPRFGCINIHASLLPRWRGAAPIQRALLAGDRMTGISIMRMERGLDTGPVLAAQSLPIGARDSAQSLHERLAQLGAELLLMSLDELAQGTACERAQPAEGITYAAKIDKSEAAIDWRETAEHIDRQIRAFNPWPVAHTEAHGRTLRILEAQLLAAGSAEHPAGTVLRQADEGIEVACGRGGLRLLTVQLEGRKALPVKVFLQGTKLPPRLGAA